MEFSLEGTTLHVSDVERSLEFYGRIPGAVVQVHRPRYAPCPR
jgi:catechol 2,3-dioxygenase-like lactoylglutathione lyase family enzyme